jgi:hypothetical protein
MELFGHRPRKEQNCFSVLSKFVFEGGKIEFYKGQIAFIGAAEPAPSTQFLLTAIASVVLGGVSLFGGTRDHPRSRDPNILDLDEMRRCRYQNRVGHDLVSGSAHRAVVLLSANLHP